MRATIAALSIAFMIASTSSGFAQPHGGGGGGPPHGGGGPPHGGGGAPPPHGGGGAPPHGGGFAPPHGAGFGPPPGAGFQLNHELNPPQHIGAPLPAAAPHFAPPPQAAAPQRFTQPQQQAGAPQRRYPEPVARVPVAVHNNPQHPLPHNPGGGLHIPDPRFHGGAWGWNRGVAWNPAPAYWGGGFWGAYPFSALAATFGALDYDGQTYDSYNAYPDSPGATLLANYQLTQEPCGGPGLVQIWGPDNSLICAFPNAIVAPGNYDIDPATLTLISE